MTIATAPHDPYSFYRFNHVVHEFVNENGHSPEEIILEPHEYEELRGDLPPGTNVRAIEGDPNAFLLLGIRVTRMNYHEPRPDTRPREIGEWAEEPPVPNTTRDWIRNNIRWEHNQQDYAGTHILRGILQLTMSVREHTGDFHEERAQDQIIDHFYHQLNNNSNNPPVYTFADDTLRDYIFWLHQNIKDEHREEADTKFNSLKDMIWPSDMS